MEWKLLLLNWQILFNNFEALADYLENSSSSFNLAEAIHAATEKHPLVAADEMGFWDSVSKQLRKISWTNILASIKAFTDGLYVALTGDQTIAGIKTFSSFPVTPASDPSSDYEVANKKYVDDHSGGGGGTPGGSDSQVQFNDAGAFGGSPDFLFDDAGRVVYLGEPTGASAQGHRFGFDSSAAASHSLYTWGTGLINSIKGYFARGTKASPTAVQSSDVLMQFRGAGYDGVTGVTSSVTNGEVRVVAAENFDGTHHGANVEIHATPTASTVLTKILTILGSGHVNIESGKQYQVNGTQHVHSEYQPIDSDLTDIAALSPSNDDIIQRKSGHWTKRTLAQLISDITSGMLNALSIYSQVS